MIACNGGVMVKLSEQELKMLIKGGETNTVELKLAAPRAVDLAERLCGMANADYSCISQMRQARLGSGSEAFWQLARLNWD